MGRTRLIVLAAFAATLIGFAHPKEARATTCTVPNTFTTGTTINAAPFNANFTALATCGNNIDNSNIGSAGIYASQIICSTVATCTFGATAVMTFPTTIASTVAPASADAFTWQNYSSGTTTGLFASGATVATIGATALGIAQNGGSNLLTLDNSGDLGILGGAYVNGVYSFFGNGTAGGALNSLGTAPLYLNLSSGGAVTIGNGAGGSSGTVFNTNGTAVIAGATTVRGAYVAPVVNASGTALASTTHTVATTISAVTTNTCATAVNCLLSPNSVTFTANAVFASTPVCTATAVGSPIGLDESIVSTTGVSVVGYNISSSSITSGTAATIHILCTGA
jgi:hypothetical protein